MRYILTLESVLCVVVLMAACAPTPAQRTFQSAVTDCLWHLDFQDNREAIRGLTGQELEVFCEELVWRDE